MKITLRRASQVQTELARAIQTVANKVTPIEVFTLSDKVDPLAKRADAVAKLMDNLEDFYRLNEVQIRLRSAIGGANATSEVSGILSKLAVNKNVQAKLAQLIDIGGEAQDDESWSFTWKTMLDKLTSGDSYDAYHSRINANLVTSDLKKMLTDHLVVLKRESNDLSDKLLFINTNTAIEISDEDWATLQKHGVV